MSGSLTIRRARLALPDRTVTGDVVVEDGLIAQIGPAVGRTVGEEIDADGQWLLPGAIDALARLPTGDAASVRTATGAALATGVTSMLIEASEDPPQDHEALRARLASLAGVSATHFGVYAAGDPARPEASEALERTPGIRLPFGWRGEGEDPDPEALEALVAAGDRPLVVDGSLPSRRAARDAVYEGSREPEEHDRIHTSEEVLALWDRLLPLARKHGRPLHVARVASEAEILWLADHAAGEGVLSASVSAAHLFMRRSAVARMHERAVCDPPLRGEVDQAALWEALRQGTLDLVSSGHETVPAVVKDQAYPATPGGLPTASAWWPLLLDRAVRGELSLRRLVHWSSEAPARRFGLPRLGRLEVGFDADLVLVDPDGDLSLRPPNAGGLDWSPFAGFTLRGRPVMTILRGEPVWRDGASTGAPIGRELGFTGTS